MLRFCEAHWRSVVGWRWRCWSRAYSMSTPFTSKYAACPKVGWGEGMEGPSRLYYSHTIWQVELHVHADGSCRPATLQELARKHDCPYPYHDSEQFNKLVTLPSVMPSLTEFLKVFDVVKNILR